MFGANEQTRQAGPIGHRILFVTSEIADFVKVGGLGDVSAALPRALARRHDVRVLIPGYREVLDQVQDLEWVATLPAHADIPSCDLARCFTRDGLQIYVLLQQHLYERCGTPYLSPEGDDWHDNDLRFGRLSLAAAEIAGGIDPDWRPQVVHANDWPTALAPAYLAWRGARVPTVFTIHNLAYQGLFNRGSLGRLGIPDAAFHVNGLEFYDRVSFMKAGIFYASHVTTVSQTYAREITRPEAGCGLDGLLRTRCAEGRLSGILNGIDEQWDPRSEPQLYRNFEAGDWTGKKQNAAAVRRRFGLAVSRGPLFAVVSRLVEQKGIDLIIETVDDIISAGGQIVVTGTGERHLERRIEELVERHPGQVGAHIGFDEAEAKNVFAGSDFLLMPSRFEPCGLSQMYAQRYGSLPIAHRVGGLADSIRDGVDGLLFQSASASSFCGALVRAFGLFAEKGRLNRMRRTAMGRTVGWKEACSDYELVYARAVGNG
ncbi:MAG: glgA [Hyphomicrobiales bacterium]|jgi:starch synthase|nr:glgA [Hyphomicrobiales bacterium]